jgi:uncharacterized protein (DUF433 family)
MTSFRKHQTVRSEVVSDPLILGAEPVLRGTRIPAQVIVSFIHAGHSHQEIFENYPSLPPDGIEAVERWAEKELGPDWRVLPAPGKRYSRS